MRSSYPKRPVGTHTWVIARWLPTDKAIIYKDDGHAVIYCHPDSLFAGNQKHVHHLVAVSKAMLNGDISVETESIFPLVEESAAIHPRHAQNLIRYMARSEEPKEVGVFMTAYGIIASGLPDVYLRQLQGHLHDRMLV